MKLKTEHGFEFELDANKIFRAIDVLLYLAPKEFRNGAKDLRDLYKIRVELEETALKEEEAEVEDNLKQGVENAEKDAQSPEEVGQKEGIEGEKS